MRPDWGGRGVGGVRRVCGDYSLEVGPFWAPHSSKIVVGRNSRSRILVIGIAVNMCALFDGEKSPRWSWFQ